MAVAFLLALLAPVAQAGPGEIEIQFAPMGGDDGDLLSAIMGGGVPGRPPRGVDKSSNNPQEADLDRMLEAMLGGGGPSRGRMRSSMMPRQSSGFFGIPVGMGGDGPFSGRRGSSPFGDGAIMIESGPPGSPQIIQMSGGPSGLPAGLLRDLFPGPLTMGGGFDHPQPFDRPDPAVQDLLSDLDTMFASTILPMVHKSGSVDRAPNACQSDLKAHCADPSVKSQVHCLGQHQADISEACHKEVGKSVPFRCHIWIDKFCDVLEGGLLPCLQNHLAEVDERCKDAVLATQRVIVKANTEKASVVDPATGDTKVSAPVAMTNGGGASVNPSVASMLNLANRGYASFSEEAQSWDARWWAMWVVAPIVGIGLFLYALTFTRYCPRQLRALFTLDKVEKNALLKGVEMPKPTDEAFIA